MRQTALIIDDEVEICQLLVNYLVKKNYVTYYALTLNEGIEICRLHLPKLIFLDNNLPDGTGIPNIKKLQDLNPGCKVIVISAMTNLEEKALSSGAIAFISKPISFENIDKFI